MKGFPAWVLICLAAAAGSGVQAADAPPAAVVLNIEAQPVRTALKAFGEQTGMQVLLRMEDLSPQDLMAPEVKGTLTPQAALEQILQRSGLAYEFINARTVRIAKPGSVPSAGAGSQSGELLLAQEIPAAPAHSSEQDADEGGRPASANSSSGVPEILVTGSRSLNMDIRRTRDDLQPYSVFNTEDLKRSGAASVEQFLRGSLPTMNAITTQSQSRSGGEISRIGLRGLGPEQTLILIDGRRAPSLSLGGSTAQADLNSIPLSAIERIEVLSATAAGIYGGGATGGVINVVLKRNYNGVETTLTREDTLDGGGAGNRVDLSGGFGFENGRSSLTFRGSYSNREDLQVGDRDLVQRARDRLLQANRAGVFGAAVSPLLGYTTNIRSNDAPVAGVRPSLTLKPAFGGGAVGSPYTSVPVGYAGPSTDNGAGLIARSGQYNLDFADTAQSNGGNRQSLFNAPIIKSLDVTLRRDFGDRVQAFVDLSGSSNDGSFITNNLTGTFNLAATAPGNPFNQAIVVTTPVFGADRQTRVSLKNRQAAGGVIVSLPADWQASADATWARSRYFAATPNTALLAGAAAAVSSGALNLFRDGNAFAADFSPYVIAPATDGPAHNTQTDFVARAAGPAPFSLPGGSAKVTTSVERRREALDDYTKVTPTPAGAGVTNAMNTFYSRKRTVDSAYVEILLPIVAERNQIPWVRQFDVQLSGRWDRYKTDVSNSTSTAAPQAFVPSENSSSSIDPVMAVRWQPVQDVAMRASFGTGFNPPSLTDLAPSTSTDLTPFLSFLGLTDPLRGNEALGATGNSVASIGGGNPDLRPEESRSASAGIILTPRVLPGLRLSIDRTLIRKTDNVSFLQLSQPSIALESVVPGFVLRAAPGNDGFPVGPIIGFNGIPLNFASQKIEAYDIAAEYRFNPGRFGEFVFSAAATRNVRNDVKVTPVSAVRDQLGLTAFSKLQGNATLSWNRGAWGASWTSRYTDPYWLNTAHTVVVSQGSARVASELYHDAQVGYSPAERGGGPAFLSNSEVRLGVRNIFNRRPNIDVSNAIAPYSQSGDPRLATYWLSLRKSFGQ